MVFQDLPLEILPEIFSHIVKPQHLASLCLVNNSFRKFAVCKLYERVSIYAWHKGRPKAIKILTKLFETLSHYPYLALLVYRFEIRYFPKTDSNLDDNLLRYVLSGLKNCANLRSCSWTQYSSLNSNILEALHQCKNLRELALNGDNIGNYDPQLLLGFTELHRLSLNMSSAPVVSQLKPWLSATGASLRSLTLSCRALNILTDEILEAIAPSLANLEHFNLISFHTVTHRGVWAIVSSSTNGILGLTLEGIYFDFDMAAFANLCISSGALKRLRSFTMTTNFQKYMEDCVKHVVHLLSDSPLEILQVYSGILFFNWPVTDELWTPLLLTHGSRLLRISIHRTSLNWEALHSICVQCTKLEKLFVYAEPRFLDKLSSCLSSAKALRTIHINHPLGVVGDPVLPQSQALSILNKCSPTVTQFGFNAQVWQVSRTIEVNEDGSMEARRILLPYENPYIPEQFFVPQFL